MAGAQGRNASRSMPYFTDACHIDSRSKIRSPWYVLADLYRGKVSPIGNVEPLFDAVDGCGMQRLEIEIQHCAKIHIFVEDWSWKVVGNYYYRCTSVD